MAKPTKTPPVTATAPAAPDRPAPSDWVTDNAWISGVAGALTVVFGAMFYNQFNVLDKGLFFGNLQVTHSRQDSLLAAVIIVTLVMLVTELTRLLLREGKIFIQPAPELASGNHGALFLQSVKVWVLNLVLLIVVTTFYHSAGEYGFGNKAPYYQAWFRLLDWIFVLYLWAGLPYTFITRAYRHNPALDKKDLSTLTQHVIAYIVSLIPGLTHLRPLMDENDKKAALGLVVKMFFTPLMTVFFCDQFPHLVSNVGYLGNGLAELINKGTYTISRFNGDFFNISMALIFSVDVALAWCGYMVSSRWVDNQTASAEPTMLGWIVCIACYPPFQMLLGFYFSAPGDSEIQGLPSAILISIFTGLMACSYIVYMSATLWFGVRFSNLTNRGIIRTGPFSIVRHPAYASKNFAWWCVMFPVVIYNGLNNGFGLAGMQITGLILMTYTYYWRAITEERHLSADPMYLEYCKQVKYRFIPGVL